ncbi:MAG: DUF362 domain-containing protein, partial [Clostridiales bacterium]|nr:DUF362 domain-containing protein [Clostridiales bacterium]
MDKKVFLSACKDYDEERVKAAVRELLQGFGGAAALAGGKRVLLKPNLLMAATPASCVTTHPTVISALAEEFTAAGCRVVIADSPGGPYNSLIMKRTYARCGMEPLAQKEGVTLNYDYGSKDFAFPEGKVAKSFPLITPALEADFIVSAAKLKTHGLTHMTGAVKNVFGLVPGLIKPAYHAKFSDRAQFCRMLVDLCQAVSPHFSVIDGVMGMEGRGPSGGRPKFAGVLIGSRNPHAADLAACQIMGLDMSRAVTLTDAVERGLIPASYKELEYAGGEVKDFQQKFAPPHKTASFIGFMPKK